MFENRPNSEKKMKKEIEYIDAWKVTLYYLLKTFESLGGQTYDDASMYLEGGGWASGWSKYNNQLLVYAKNFWRKIPH